MVANTASCLLISYPFLPFFLILSGVGLCPNTFSPFFEVSGDHVKSLLPMRCKQSFAFVYKKHTTLKNWPSPLPIPVLSALIIDLMAGAEAAILWPREPRRHRPWQYENAETKAGTTYVCVSFYFFLFSPLSSMLVSHRFVRKTSSYCLDLC